MDHISYEYMDVAPSATSGLDLWAMLRAECDEYIQILNYFRYKYLFGYIFQWSLYMNISWYSFESKTYSLRVWRLFKYPKNQINLIQKSIWRFVRIVLVDTNILWYSLASFYWYEYLQILVCFKIDTNVTLWLRATNSANRLIPMSMAKIGHSHRNAPSYRYRR